MPNTTAAVTLRRRFPMKNVMSGRNDDGTVVIGSTRSDIKLDKLTNCVFAADELLPTKWISFALYGVQDTSSQLPSWGIC